MVRDYGCSMDVGIRSYPFCFGTFLPAGIGPRYLGLWKTECRSDSFPRCPNAPLDVASSSFAPRRLKNAEQSDEERALFVENSRHSVRAIETFSFSRTLDARHARHFTG